MESSRLRPVSNKLIVYGSVALLFLSVIDAILTLRGLNLGIIEEANPIMYWLIAQSPVVFIAVKLALPVILLLLAWWSEKKLSKVIPYLFEVVLIAYTVAIGFHVWWILAY